MTQSIKVHNIAHPDKLHVAQQLVSKFVLPIVMWLPHKFTVYGRVRDLHQQLQTLENAIFKYKLHWGFSENSPLSSLPSGAERFTKESGVPDRNFLALDDLDESIRSLLFQLNSYSLWEKLVYFDIEKHEDLVQDYQCDLERIISESE